MVLALGEFFSICLAVDFWGFAIILITRVSFSFACRFQITRRCEVYGSLWYNSLLCNLIGLIIECQIEDCWRKPTFIRFDCCFLKIEEILRLTKMFGWKDLNWKRERESEGSISFLWIWNVEKNGMQLQDPFSVSFPRRYLEGKFKATLSLPSLFPLPSRLQLLI